ncbi:MAG: family 16 glycoside hydrolase [Pirellulales bacterium]
MRYAAVILSLSLVSVSAADEQFEELFNGRDLAGWDADERIWSVEDGLLTGQTRTPEDLKHNTFAIWTGGEVEDFELRIEVRMEGDNNSGVQYRSAQIPGRKWGVAGYQADLHPAPNYSGMLYDEGGRGILAERGQRVTVAEDGTKQVERLDGDVAPIDLREWNELEITAKGNRLVHKLNGQVTMELTDGDPKHADAKGILALQVHAGPAMKVQFKSIKLKRLEKEAAEKDEEKETSETSTFDATATPVERINVPDGFRVELLYSIPKDRQGSWVNLCVDPKGRLIVSDQYGGLYRVAVPPKGDAAEPVVEKIPVQLGQAQGLLCAFGDLYVVVNGNREDYDNGLYQVRDIDGDDQYDSVKLLRAIDGDGEHGPHAVLVAPDGKSLYVVCGNNTKLIEINHSRVPQVWDEDRLLPRIYGVGFMRGARAPAGCIYRVSPDGQEWELVNCGFRNPFDIALNADGELFTFDADMEWDLGTGWYRPTRVCHMVSGADWGWRVSSAKWPVHYADTLPAAVDIGLTSPTGITFGYGAKFPAKYQQALYLCDWTYGKLYAAHLEPRGSSYGGTFEEFITASPLPLTDAIINPHDGAMYFLIGGRNTQSGLYRVTYAGPESIAPANAKQPGGDERALRHKLEALHRGEHPEAVQQAWPHLGHADRFVRHAARTALEHKPLEGWQQRALQETNPQAALTSLLALVRKIPRSYQPDGVDADTPPPTYPADDAVRHELQPAVLAALDRLDWPHLSNEQQLELLRVYALALYRLGPPDEPSRQRLIERFDAIYPATDTNANVMLTELLCYLQAPSAAEKGIKLLSAATTQEEQLDLAHSLRFLESGWTPETRRAFFDWIYRAQGYKGGNNFTMFIGEIKTDALARLPESDRLALQELIDAPAPSHVTPLSAEPRPLVKEWTMNEILPLVETKLKHRDFDRGRKMFAATNCFGCHRFANEGGAVGPDLTGLAGRFSARDILESVMEPDKVISDQYAAVVVQTTAGKVITGRIVNFDGDVIHVNTDMLDPTALEMFSRDEIEDLSTAKASMMPAGLLNTLHEDELLDLMAFLLSRGDREHEMFAK